MYRAICSPGSTTWRLIGDAVLNNAIVGLGRFPKHLGFEGFDIPNAIPYLGAQLEKYRATRFGPPAFQRCLADLPAFGYENREKNEPYVEDEALGGYDPYSSSKACSELVTSAYRRSFMESLSIGIASARAGNVIGGGDWSDDRLLPDFLRSIDAGKTLMIR